MNTIFVFIPTSCVGIRSHSWKKKDIKPAGEVRNDMVYKCDSLHVRIAGNSESR